MYYVIPIIMSFMGPNDVIIGMASLSPFLVGGKGSEQ